MPANILPPPDDDEPDDVPIADIIAVCQVALIFMLLLTILLTIPVEHPEWFN